MSSRFEEEYKRLNKAQKEAVDTIYGPVMVVAGPGTGKTQILALRIANILKNGTGEANEILCLTFTNSGVRAMKHRLEEYIGREIDSVRIATFHSFALELIQDNFSLLGFNKEPKLLSDDEAVFLVDKILNNNEWQYIRPRTNPEMYFNDLKHLVSLLKRERLTHEYFLNSVEKEIRNIKKDPTSISSRGPTKGKIKKEVEIKIESLERTREVVEFYKIYEEQKLQSGVMDYDDVLEYVVKLAEEYEDIRYDIKEKYQYILVDEHQDSSGVQNDFLKSVWQGEEKPNIFVVGDDRQLIYAFSGASLEYFEEFSHIFGKAKLVTLTENYRSTQNILELSHDLLQSSITKEKLKSNLSGSNPILLNEYSFPRDEIIGAGIYFKQKIAEGVKPEECALLVPKNHHVRSAMNTLANLDLPVSSGKDVSLFSTSLTESFVRILKIIVDPYEPTHLAESLLDETSGVETLEAHKFLKNIKARTLTIADFKNSGAADGLFRGEDKIAKWGELLETWVNTLSSVKVSNAIAVVGNYLIDNSKDHEKLIQNVEVVRTFIHLAEMFEDKNNKSSLPLFLEYFARLESYGTHIGLAVFGKNSGIQVMTLHKSKGLEYKAVWVAHMNEEVFMSEKRSGFSLPENIKERMNERSIETAKRELYVAITRAKEFCALSYASENYTGGDMNLVHIIRELPEVHFVNKSKEETEGELLAAGPEIFTKFKEDKDETMLEELKNFVKDNYTDAKVSVTLLNNFFECPWKWYFRNFLKLPEVKGVSLALGSAVHFTIEFILNESKVPNEQKINEYIKSSLIHEGVREEKELARLYKDALVSVDRFLKDFYPNLEKNRQSERSVQFRDPKIPHLLMYGKIDLTERLGDGTLAVTDFKTGKSKTKNIIEKLDDEGRPSSYMRQLAMYSYLIHGAEKKLVSNSRLLFLEADEKDKNVLYSTRIDDEQIDLLLRDIRDYDNLLKSGEWVSGSCNFNSYGKYTECEYCKRAKIYK